MKYPKNYHLACAHLIRFGIFGGDTQAGRNLIASALKQIREERGRNQAISERFHLSRIAGGFPIK